MMDVISFLAGVGWGLAANAALSWALRSRKPDPRQDAPSQTPQQPPRNPSSPWQWHAMPGGRLELGDTGFYITLNTGQPDKVYQGFTPEHRRIVYGLNLASMKRFLESEAKERADFEPPAGGWRLR